MLNGQRHSPPHPWSSPNPWGDSLGPSAGALRNSTPPSSAQTPGRRVWNVRLFRDGGLKNTRLPSTNSRSRVSPELFELPQSFSSFPRTFWASTELFELPQSFLSFHRTFRASTELFELPQSFLSFHRTFRASTELFRLPQSFFGFHRAFSASTELFRLPRRFPGLPGTELPLLLAAAF